ncbi:MAG: tRNA guanosine(34) transglycosylase Tgt [Myxococcales bacterium]|nr:tRNA guanosine(34) transglycosylase Tgt [Myxococcales bacterium]
MSGQVAKKADVTQQALHFEIVGVDQNARLGRISTAHGVVETPAFMPVGTLATVKSLAPHEVAETGARMILANTYHLWLRPGADCIASLGGVQKFMAWPHAVLTDSGGYQVYSLAKLRKISDDGVSFRSHLSGELKFLTPEIALHVQGRLGSDIAMVLDECPPANAARPLIETAMRRTTAWAKRSLDVPDVPGQARFGIVQGGTHLDLRSAHLDEIAAMPFAGLALGGFSVGEPPEKMHELLDQLAFRMPQERPRYLMGVGTPKDLLMGVMAGIDMFDCVLPTRNGRNGQAFTSHGPLNLKNARHREDSSPIDACCECSVCHTFSRAYVRHLFHAHEMLGPRLISQHNLHFYGALMAGARRAIATRAYGRYVQDTLARLEGPN